MMAAALGPSFSSRAEQLIVTTTPVLAAVMGLKQAHHCCVWTQVKNCLFVCTVLLLNPTDWCDTGHALGHRRAQGDSANLEKGVFRRWLSMEGEC